MQFRVAPASLVVLPLSRVTVEGKPAGGKRARRYLIGYLRCLASWNELIVAARQAAGLTQAECARLAETSRPALSAYEHGRKAPTADTLDRLLAAARFRLDAAPVVTWQEVPAGRRACWVPDRLWRIPLEAALADVVLPVELNWSTPGRRFSCRDPRDRARLYEVLLREGGPTALERWVDGGFLVDAWDDLVLPRGVRAAWQPVVDATLGERHEVVAS